MISSLIFFCCCSVDSIDMLFIYLHSNKYFSSDIFFVRLLQLKKLFKYIYISRISFRTDACLYSCLRFFCFNYYYDYVLQNQQIHEERKKKRTQKLEMYWVYKLIWFFSFFPIDVIRIDLACWMIYYCAATIGRKYFCMCVSGYY